MDYDTFMNEVPSDTKELILNAISIYKEIEFEDLNHKYKSYTCEEKLNKTDKKCAALFLSGLTTNTDVKRIMNDNEITIERTLKYFDKDIISFDSLNEEEYREYYNNDFKLLLGQLINNEELQYCYPEKIILSASSHHCSSSIIDYIYYYLNINIFGAITSNSFNDLRESLKQKVSEKNRKNRRSFGSLLGLDSSTFENNEKEDNFITKYGEFLTDRDYKTNPSIGREKEIRNVMLSLLTPDKSVILTGEAGVGKTAIVEGLAYLIQNKKVPKLLEDKKIIKINTSSLVNGCMYVGMFEERVEKLLKELSENKNIILFIDEIHTVIGAGAGSKSNNDLSSILKPYLDRGQIKMIGATTNEEYDNIMEDPAFRRRFERVNVLEPNEKIISEIMMGTIGMLEEITEIKFDFNNYDKQRIIDFIVSTTNNKARVYNDKGNNPDLSLSILKKSFAIAAFNDSNFVKIEDIAEAIMSCDRLYETVRTKKSRMLLSEFNTNNIVNKQENVCKIIKFPNL